MCRYVCSNHPVNLHELQTVVEVVEESNCCEDLIDDLCLFIVVFWVKLSVMINKSDNTKTKEEDRFKF